MEKQPISFEQFEKTAYHTRLYVVLPLLGRMKLTKTDYFKNGKLDNKLLSGRMYELYLENIKRLI